VDVSDLKVISSLVTIEGISEDMPTVAIEVLDFSGKGVEADTSVTLEYSVSTSGVWVLSVGLLSSAGLLSVISDVVSGVLLSVRKGYVTVSILVVAISSVGVDTASEVVKVKMEDVVEGISVDIVPVKLEVVVSVTSVSSNDVVNLEDKDDEVVEYEYISPEVVSDVDGDVGEEGTTYVVTWEVIVVSSVVSPVGITAGHVSVEGTSVMAGGEGSKVVEDGRI